VNMCVRVGGRVVGDAWSVVGGRWSVRGQWCGWIWCCERMTLRAAYVVKDRRAKGFSVFLSHFPLLATGCVKVPSGARCISNLRRVPKKRIA